MNIIELLDAIMNGTEEDLDAAVKQYEDHAKKYEVVRYLVMDALKDDPMYNTLDFHFTPGPAFDATPAIETAQTILNQIQKSRTLEGNYLGSTTPPRYN